MLHDLQNELIGLNNQYKENELVITKLQQQLIHYIKNTFTSTDLINGIQFCEDRLTLFRFLLETKYDYEKAYKLLIDNIAWRLEEKVDQLTWHDFQDWLKEGFVYYHQYDRLDQPMMILQLKYFPLTIYQQDKVHFGEKLKSFACFMMETARKWTWYETMQKLKKLNDGNDDDDDDDDNQQPFLLFLTLHLNVIVDMTSTPFLPMDKVALELLAHTMEFRYPRFVGKIHVLNFSWVHQTLWQILKFILSEETKNKIIFTTHQHLLQVIPKENLLKEFGGSDDYEWAMETNEVIQKYGIQTTTSDVLSPKLKSVLSLSHPNEEENHYTNDNHPNFHNDDDDNFTQPSYGSMSLSSSSSFRNTHPNILHYFGFSAHQVGLHHSGFLSAPYRSHYNSCLTTPLITAKKNNLLDIDDDDHMLLSGDIDDEQFSLNSSSSSSIFTTHSNETITDGSTLIGHSSILTDEDDNNNNINNNKNNNNKDRNNHIHKTFNTTVNDILFINNNNMVLKKQLSPTTSIISPLPTSFFSNIMDTKNDHSPIIVHQSIQTDPIIIIHDRNHDHHHSNKVSFIIYSSKNWMMFRKAVFCMIMYIILRIPIESFFYLQLNSYTNDHQHHLLFTIGVTALFAFFMTPILHLPNNTY